MSGELLGGADTGLSWKDECQAARKGVDGSGSEQWGRRRPAVGGGTVASGQVSSWMPGACTVLGAVESEPGGGRPLPLYIQVGIW